MSVVSTNNIQSLPISEQSKFYGSTSYEVDEEVFIYYMNFTYRGVVLEKEVKDGHLKYFVRYNQFPSRYNEWLTPVRLRKISWPEFIELERQQLSGTRKGNKHQRTDDNDQAEEKTTHVTTITKSTAATNSNAPYNPGPVDISKKRIVELQMPLTLRRKLVDDQDWIIERKMVIPSPRDPTVRLILNDYLASHGCPDLSSPILSNERTGRVRSFLSFFNLTVQEQLLFDVEKQALGKTKIRSPCDHYGVEHLLRFFFRLPLYIEVMFAEHDVCERLVTEAASVLQYLDQHRAELFLTAYDIPPLVAQSSFATAANKSNKK